VVPLLGVAAIVVPPLFGVLLLVLCAAKAEPPASTNVIIAEIRSFLISCPPDSFFELIWHPISTRQTVSESATTVPVAASMRRLTQQALMKSL
jgi:hypothetical protein